MPAVTEKIWSCVGSAGTVNPPDIGKVVLVGSIAQLGPGRVIPEVAGRGAGPQMQAVIRYGVTAVVDSPPNPIPRVGLEILCRQGGGQIAARLVKVLMSGPQPSVAEATVVEFQAQPVDRNPNLFHSQVSFAPSVFFDSQEYVYYVEVVLTASADVVTEYPPAVSAIQLYFVVDG